MGVSQEVDTVFIGANKLSSSCDRWNETHSPVSHSW